MGGRSLVALLAVLGGGIAAAILVPRTISTIDDLHHRQSQLTGWTAAAAPHGPGPRSSGRRRSNIPAPGGRPISAPSARRPPKAQTGGDLRTLLLAAQDIAGGVLLLVIAFALLAVRRAIVRTRREYALYELHLSTHDQAKDGDIEDMVESIANTARAWPIERLRSGQPYVAFELICGERADGDGESEWSLNVRCEPRVAEALDSAISAAYPDVRLGRVHGRRPTPRAGRLREPGYVMRFRKQRSIVYPLMASEEAIASPPLEQIARAQTGLGEPSIVRFQLWPTPAFFELVARRLYRRREQQLSRHERWGERAGGLWLTLDRAEMGSARRAQNRSLFWLEVVVASSSVRACRTIAAVVQSRRGENRLGRRVVIARQRLYRRRFPDALGPLIPSLRTLVSASEIAHLLALPSARMKGVPVRRTAVPRMPAPPQALRATETGQVRTPTKQSRSRSPTPTDRPFALR